MEEKEEDLVSTLILFSYNVRALHFFGQGFFGKNIVNSAFVSI